MTSDRACFIHEGYITMYASYFRDILQCSDCCQETMTTEGSCFIAKGWITMLWPLSCDDDNWRSMFFIHEGYIAMLWPLSWVDDNWRRMFRTWVIYYYALTVVMWLWQLTEHFYIWGIYYHALTVVMRWWHLTEHDWYYSGLLPCYERCHETMTTGWACFKPLGCITMLCPLL